MEGLIVILFFGAVAFACHLSYETQEINESLKQEVYELKKELAECKEEKRELLEEKDELFSSYIDLGIKCGANE